MAKLQIAVDLASFDELLALADRLHDVVDIFEVGTPVIMQDGFHPVRAIKARYPDLTVLADTKIVDGGSIECADACRAGADIVTVLALADDATVSGVIKTAHRHGKKAMADLICAPDIAGRARELVDMGIDFVCVHTAVDVQKRGITPLDELKTLVKAINSEKAVAAGGISPMTVGAYLDEDPAIVIMGSALTGAKDPLSAAREAAALCHAAK